MKKSFISRIKDLFRSREELILEERQKKLREYRVEIQNEIDKLNKLELTEYNRGVKAAYICVMNHINDYLNISTYNNFVCFQILHNFISDSHNGIFNNNPGLEMKDFEIGYDYTFGNDLCEKFKEIITLTL